MESIFKCYKCKKVKVVFDDDILSGVRCDNCLEEMTYIGKCRTCNNCEVKEECEKMNNCDQCSYCLYNKDGICQNDKYSFDFEDNCLEFENKITYDKGYQQGRADQKKADNEFFNFESAYEMEKQKIRADAIDEFVEFANTMPTVEEEDGEIRPMWLEEMAQKLKEQSNE